MKFMHYAALSGAGRKASDAIRAVRANFATQQTAARKDAGTPAAPSSELSAAPFAAPACVGVGAAILNDALVRELMGAYVKSMKDGYVQREADEEEFIAAGHELVGGIDAVVARLRAMEARPTDLSRALRATAAPGPDAPSPTIQALLQRAADEIERYFGGMQSWKRTAEAKDVEYASNRASAIAAAAASINAVELFHLVERYAAMGGADRERKALLDFIAVHVAHQHEAGKCEGRKEAGAGNRTGSRGFAQ